MRIIKAKGGGGPNPSCEIPVCQITNQRCRWRRAALSPLPPDSKESHLFSPQIRDTGEGKGKGKFFFPFVQRPNSFSRLLEKYTPCDKDPPSLLRSVGSESSGRSLTLVSHIFFQEKRTKQKKIRIIKGQSQPRAPANLREKIKSCSAVVFLLLLHFPRVMRARETEGCELEMYICSDFQGRTRGII